jgi:hypothetical protein
MQIYACIWYDLIWYDYDYDYDYDDDLIMIWYDVIMIMIMVLIMIWLWYDMIMIMIMVMIMTCIEGAFKYRMMIYVCLLYIITTFFDLFIYMFV